MSAEDLDERDLECRNLAVHEDAGQIQLHLEAHVNIGPVDGWRPPEREASVGNLVETGALGHRQLLVLHLLLEAARLLPEQTLPRGEVGAFEQRMLENSFDTAQCLQSQTDQLTRDRQESISTSRCNFFGRSIK